MNLRKHISVSFGSNFLAYRLTKGVCIILILAAGMLSLSGCCERQPRMQKKTFFVMGSIASVSVPEGQIKNFNRFATILTNSMYALECKLSIYKPESDISQLNALAGRSPLVVSPETFSLLELSKRYYKISGGAFDVTVGPLLYAWGFRDKKPLQHVLTERELAPLLEQVGSAHIILSGKRAFLDKENVKVDLGGIAKGYAVDFCCQTLLNYGISNALVDLGGNIRVLGASESGKPWCIGVCNPFDTNLSLGILRLPDGQAVATSGNYERFVTIAGERYAHIIDPRTGKPVKGIAAVTVISPLAVEADALSTALFVQGINEGLKTLSRSHLSSAMFIPDKRPVEVWLTEGFAACFEPDASLKNRVFLLKQEE